MAHALVLDPATAKAIAVVEGYNRLAWSRHLWDGGNFTLEVSLYVPGAQNIQRGMLLVPDPDDVATVYLVEQVERELGESGRESEVLRVSGRSLVGLLAQRLVIPPSGQAYDRQASVTAETAIKHYVDVHAGPGAPLARRIPNLTIAPDQARGVTVSVDGRYQTVLDLIRQIGRLAGMGYEITYNAATAGLVFDVVPGVDRSATVFLAPSYESVRGQSWLQSDLDRVTYVLVAGQGEGAAREVVARYLGASEPSGFERREAFLDARDVQLGQTAVLQARGDAVLAEAGLEDRVEAQVYEHGSFQPGRDYDLGDLVTLQNDAWGLSRVARVVELRYELAQGVAVPRVTVALDRPYPTVKERLVGPSSISAQGAVDYHREDHAARHAPGGPDDISSNYVRKAGDTMTGSLGIQGTANVLELGAGVSGKEANAGKIGYQRFSTDALDIVGAGPNAGSRKIRFWAEGGSIFNGLVQAPRGLVQPSSDSTGILRVLTTGGLDVLRADTSPARTYTLGRLVWSNATITLANGDNNNVGVTDAANFFVTGPTADFAITGLANAESGRVVTIINTTSYVMVLRHESASSTAANRILTPTGTDIACKSAVLVYHGASSRWRVVDYVPHLRMASSYNEASSSVTITAGAGEVYGNLIWAPQFTVPPGFYATFFAVGSARLTSGAPAACQIAYHSGGTAYRSIPIYADSNSVISVNHLRSFQGPTTVTPELVGITAPGGPNATFERRSLSVVMLLVQ